MFSGDCFSAGTLAQEDKVIFAFECLSSGAIALECLGVWHSIQLSVKRSGTRVVLGR